MGFAEFLNEVSGAMIEAQEQLERQTEAYLAGTSNPRPLPSLFRIPRLQAKMKFALDTKTDEKLGLIFSRSSESEGTQLEQSLEFDILAVPPPPESGLVPGPYLVQMPRLELLVESARREWFARVRKHPEAREKLGVPPAGSKDLLVWEFVRPREATSAGRLYLYGKTFNQVGREGPSADLFLVRLQDGDSAQPEIEQWTVPRSMSAWLGEFLAIAGVRQAELDRE
jgi:hypothetical protein